MKTGIIQFNPTIGDVEGNTNKILKEYERLSNTDAELIAAQELSLTGYPPRDLLHRPAFIDAVETAIAELAAATTDGPPLVVGAPLRTDQTQGPPLNNGVVVLRNGTQTDTYAKRLLPTYDVFDERRYFDPGLETTIIEVNDTEVGITICEDAWNDVEVTGQQRHTADPLLETSQRGADVILTISASPFSVNKPYRREQRFIDHAAETGCPVVFVTQVGGNDELVFDGHSLIATKNGITHRFSGFTEHTGVVEIPDHDTQTIPRYDKPTQEQIRETLTLGIEDYFTKTGFTEAVIGLSGGIDSSVCAGLAVDALGSENVYGVSLPAAVTDPDNTSDAETVANALGIEFDVIPIAESVGEVTGALSEHADRPSGVAYENIQARIRGDVLMAIANQRDALVLTPDNKSEAAVGYCTLYGDTVGGIAPLGDCYKHVVYALAESLNITPPENTTERIIPQRIVEKQPTAELRDGQTDTDDLPPYDVLDDVLKEYIEQTTPVSEMQSTHDVDTVQEVVDSVSTVEFKRRQTPTPLRITQKALGRGWQYPVAADYDSI